MHAAKEGAVLLVDLERGRQLGEDAIEGAGLDPCGSTAGVARKMLAGGIIQTELDLPVHWIALPNHNMSTVLYSLNMSAEHRLNLLCTVAGDQRDLADFLVWVDNVQQLYKLLVLHRRPNLDTDRVLNATEVLDMASVNLACSVSDPNEVSRSVVPALAVV